MRRALLGSVLVLVAGFALTGCDPKPSVPVAPDVKEPDNRGVSGAEILRRKQASESGAAPGAAANTAPR